MKKKGVGLLLGMSAGLGLVWFFRRQIAGLFDKRVDIEVEDGKDGPRVVEVTPETVTVKHNGHVRWTVHNHSRQDVVISLRDWQDTNREAVPPAVDPDPDDSEQPPQDGLSRKVFSGKKRPIRGRARKPQKDGEEANEEDVKYAVYLGDDLAIDPIVKLVV